MLTSNTIEKSETNDTVLRLIWEQSGRIDGVVERETKITDIGDLDSLDNVELCMACEDEFSFEIADQEWEPVQTVGQMVDLVNEKLGTRR